MWAQLEESELRKVIRLGDAAGEHQLVVKMQSLLDASKKRASAQEKMRSAARQMFGREGELEIDNDAAVSFGDDDGAYVMSWLWVSNEDTGLVHNDGSTFDFHEPSF